MRLAPFALLLAILPAVRAEEFDPKPIDAVVERALKEFRVPGAAVVVVRDDAPIYLKGFGVRALGKPEPVAPDTVFPIASCTKAFTATVLAMLADEGKLKWDDKVRDHLEFFRLSDELADREVTLRDLLCHRTGMPRHDAIGFGLTSDGGEMIRRWGKGKPSTSFRSTWEYSNVPFTTAGTVAGRIDKAEWDAVVRRRIFEPLRMKSSSATGKAGYDGPNRATPHHAALDGLIAAVKWDAIDHIGGAGTIDSTAADMANWLRFQLGAGTFEGKPLLAAKALKETHAPQMLVKTEGYFAQFFPARATNFAAYGLGWFVHDYRGHKCVSHGGTLSGIRAQCMLVPEKKLGVFVVCNLRPSLFPETVAKSVLDALLGLPTEDWVAFHVDAMAKQDADLLAARTKRESARKPNTKPSLPSKGYAGTYDEPAYGRATVVVEGDQLTLTWGRFTYRLDHYHYDTFAVVLVAPVDEVFASSRATMDAQFRLGKDGEVESLTFLDQVFKRTK